jgi:16S rRNA G1207 methylase RsmC
MERQGLEVFICGASHRLTEQGTLAMVVVRELRSEIDAILNGNSSITTVYEEHKAGHSIYHLQFTQRLKMPEESYERGWLNLALDKTYELRTARGLPEFDSPSFGSTALIKLLPKIGDCPSVFILEPGQGLSALAAADLLHARSISLASRDLLALKYSSDNLGRVFPGDIKTVALPYLSGPPLSDLIIWNLRGKNELSLHQWNLGIIKEASTKTVIYGEKSLLLSLLEKNSCAPKINIEHFSHCAVLL